MPPKSFTPPIMPSMPQAQAQQERYAKRRPAGKRRVAIAVFTSVGIISAAYGVILAMIIHSKLKETREEVEFINGPDDARSSYPRKMMLAKHRYDLREATRDLNDLEDRVYAGWFVAAGGGLCVITALAIAVAPRR